jgi:hypothetical protein
MHQHQPNTPPLTNSRLENPGILAAGTYSLSLSSKDGRIKRNIKLTHQ